MEENKQTFEQKVQMSFDSGIIPLELKFVPIHSLESESVTAFRSTTTIHSWLIGDLQERDYVDVIDEHDICLEMFKHNIKHAYLTLNKLAKDKIKFNFITVRCPYNVLELKDIYETLKELVLAYPKLDTSKILLEFPKEILLYCKFNVARSAMKDIKLLRFKTAICGCGSLDFPTSKLLHIKPDFVYLDKEVTEYVTGSSKPKMFENLVAYIRSIGIEVISEVDLNYVKSLKKTECKYYFGLDSEYLPYEKAIENASINELEDY